MRRAGRLGVITPTMTPRQSAAAVRERLDDPAARDGLRDMARAVEAARYGPPEAALAAAVPPDLVRAARRRILDGLSRSRHLG